MQRIHVPMEDLWTMPVPVPVSLLLRDGDVGWSCGQLALDRAGNVVAPDDLVGQSRVVCDYIETILDRAGAPLLLPRRIVAYYVHTSDSDLAGMIAAFRERFGTAVVLDPVPVPYFYYDGVLLEIDLFCEAGHLTNAERAAGSATVIANRGEELAWLSLDLGSEPISVGSELLEVVVGELGLSFDQLLNDRWFASLSNLAPVADLLDSSPWCADAGSVVSTGGSKASIRALFTFVHSPDRRVADVVVTDDVQTSVRQRGRFTHVQGRSLRSEDDLVTQTIHVMKTFEQVLAARELDFENVAKATAYYVGDNSPETLHGNMNIRNGYYSAPGPASTGLPVDGFADHASKITVELTLVSEVRG